MIGQTTRGGGTPLASDEAATLATEISSATGKLVYLALCSSDGSTVDGLHERLGVGRLALYSVLDSLVEAGHVDNSEGVFVPTGS